MGNPMWGRWVRLYRGTRSELALEPAVAALGRPYRFQHPLWQLGVFPDFVLHHPDDRLVLEVDGDEHFSEAGREKDAERTRRLNSEGWKVVRCSNREAVENPYATVNRMMIQAGLPWRAEAPDSWVPGRWEAPVQRAARRPPRIRA